MNNYYVTNAIYYDLEQKGLPEEELNFYRSVIGNTGEPFLEIGSGTGRISNELIKCGHRGLGIDISLPMIKEAVKKNKNGNSNYLVMDCLNLGLKKNSIQTVIAGNNIFLEFNNLMKIKVLQNVKRVISPNGSLIIDISNPNGIYGISNLDKYVRKLGKYYSSRQEIEIIAKTRVDEINQTIHTFFLTKVTNRDGTNQLIKSQIVQHYVYHSQMNSLIRPQGFDISSNFGDYDFSPITPCSNRLIYILKNSQI